MSEAQLCHSIPEAARLLGVGRRSVYRQISQGNLPVIKLGRRTLVAASALHAFIEAASQPTKAAA
jgi:excisionase family DNA binding protein